MSIQMRQRAQKLLDGVPSELLPDVIKSLESFCKDTEPPQPNADELALIQTINRRIAPTEQARIDELRDKNERGELTEIEHQELLAYVERAEGMDVIRLEAMMKLAALREVALDEIMAEFPANPGQDNDKA